MGCATWLQKNSGLEIRTDRLNLTKVQKEELMTAFSSE
jgi:hypothetical protein